MAIKAVLSKEEYDALPATLPKEQVYGAALPDGRVRIDGEAVGGWGVEDVAGLKSAYQKARNDAAAAAPYLSLGATPEQVQEALAKVKAMANWTPEEKAREMREAAIRDVESKYQPKLKSYEEQVAALERESDEYVRDAALRQALEKVEAHVDLALPLVRGMVKKTRGPDGKPRVVVVDENGNPRVSQKAGNSGDMGVDELVSDLQARKEFAPLFKSAGVSGAGTRGSAGPGFGGGRPRVPESQYRDPAQYQRLRAEFAKEGVSMDQVEVIKGQ